MKHEKWIETQLWFAKFDSRCYKKLLLSFVKPTVKSIEGSIKTLHFLFEPGLHFLFRIQPSTEDKSAKVKKLVKKHLKEISDFIAAKPEQELFVNYFGEASDFGEDGWEIVKKVFEYGSRMAIAKLDPEFKKGSFKREKCFIAS